MARLDSRGEKDRSVTVPLDWGKAKKLWKWLRGAREPKQTTFCYCKNCRNELCADPATKCYEAGNGEVHYICGKCNWQIDFLFDAPVPIFLRALPPASQSSAPSAPEDLDLSPEDMKLLKLLDAQNKDWKESHGKP